MSLEFIAIEYDNSVYMVTEIAAHPGHFVDARGTIFSEKNGEYRKRATAPNAGGYPKLNIRRDRRPVTEYVHRLVCETFHGPAPFEGALVEHYPDQTKTNVASWNLRWGSAESNYRHFLEDESIDFARVKLSPSKVRKIRSMDAAGKRTADIADHFGVSHSTIRNVISGRKWGWVN